MKYHTRSQSRRGAVLAACLAGCLSSAASAQNLLDNPSFETVGPNGAFTTFTGLGPAPNAADGWGVFNNSNGTTTTELVPSTLTDGMMLHVTTDGIGNGITNVFGAFNTGPDCVISQVWVYVVSGEVYIGTGNGGNTTNEAVSLLGADQWQLVTATDNICPANEFIVYSNSANGAEFYVDVASVEVGPCHCPYDYNDDEMIDTIDLLGLLADWGPDPECGHDAQGDNIIDTTDLLNLLGLWNTSCDPGVANNETCFDATAVFPGADSWIPYSNIGAQTDGPSYDLCDAFGDDNVGSDVWYEFIAPATGVVEASTCDTQGLPTYDTKIAAFEELVALNFCCPGEPFGAFLVACNDDADCGTRSRVTFDVIAGNCYKLRVGGFNASQGEALLRVRMLGEEPFDCVEVHQACSTSCFTTIQGSLDGHLGEFDDTSCAFNDVVDVWYCYTFNCISPPLFMDVSLCNDGTDYDTTVAVYTSFLGNLTEIGCNDDFDDPACENDAGLNRKSRVTIPNPSEFITYFIRVSGWNGASGDYELTIHTQCAPTADDPPGKD